MDSDSRKKMMTAIHQGKKCPFAKPPHFSGEKHWNWQGGITTANAKIRNSFLYKKWREAVFGRDGYICQECGQRGGILHADHIKKFSDFPELRLELANGRTLCIECHKKTDTYLNKSCKNSQKYETTGVFL